MARSADVAAKNAGVGEGPDPEQLRWRHEFEVCGDGPRGVGAVAGRRLLRGAGLLLASQPPRARSLFDARARAEKKMWAVSSRSIRTGVPTTRSSSIDAGAGGRIPRRWTSFGQWLGVASMAWGARNLISTQCLMVGPAARRNNGRRDVPDPHLWGGGGRNDCDHAFGRGRAAAARASPVARRLADARRRGARAPPRRPTTQANRLPGVVGVYLGYPFSWRARLFVLPRDRPSGGALGLVSPREGGSAARDRGGASPQRRACRGVEE